VNNNQETNRDSSSSDASDRARFEIYYPPFEGAVEAGVGSVMCSYNLINGTYSCENEHTLGGHLKSDLGFAGWVMSDWGATHSSSILEGLDQEMPGGDYFGPALTALVASGAVPEAAVNASAGRVLLPMFTLGVFEAASPWGETPNVDATSVAHTQLAEELCAASHVLVQNNGDLLPLAGGALASPPPAASEASSGGKADGTKVGAFKIAILGYGAEWPVVAGGGSGSVFPGSNVESPRAALLAALGIEDTWGGPGPCQGDGNRTEGWGWSQWGCESFHADDADDCEAKCGAYYACAFWTFNGGGCTFYPTDRYPRPKPGATSGGCVQDKPPATWMCGGPAGEQCVAFAEGTGEGGPDVAAGLAAEADVAVVVLAQFGKEGTDRDSLGFAQQQNQQCDVVPSGQDELVDAVAATGTPTVVAATCAGACLTPWRDRVSAILLSVGMPGQGYGPALASLLTGARSPRGRLPVTLPNADNEVGFTRAEYPGVRDPSDPKGYPHVHYDEGLLVDYRW